LAVVVLVDGDDPLGAHHHSAGNCELPHGAGAEHGDRLSARDVTEIGSEPAGGEDVREEEDLLVGEVILDLERTDVGVGNPRVLGLATCIAAGQTGVAEEARRPMAEELLGESPVGVAVLAHGIQLVLAGPAVAAGDGERHDHSVAHLEVRHALAELDDLAHELVAEDVPSLHRGDVPVVQVQVRATDRGGGDLHDRVAVIDDLRIGDVLHLDRVASRPHIGAHQTPTF
jgi:hypothetical protein